MIIVYITCQSKAQAEKIGKHLLSKRLAGCVNIFEKMTSLYWWPSKKRKICKDKEVVLIVKTVKEKFDQIEKEVKRLHSYKVPCIFSLKIDKVSKPYLNWLMKKIR